MSVVQETLFQARLSVSAFVYNQESSCKEDIVMMFVLFCAKRELLDPQKEATILEGNAYCQIKISSSGTLRQLLEVIRVSVLYNKSNFSFLLLGFVM